LEKKGRKLIFPIGDGSFEVVLAKAPDVITYVEHGSCDIGVVGRDTILEFPGRYYEVLDLGFGKCNFVLALPKNSDFWGFSSSKTIATKYPNVTSAYFEEKSMDVRIIRIEGSVELAPIIGLSDGIVDIVETGTTLRENGLVAVENISEISARLIVNISSLKTKQKEIDELITKLENAVTAEKTS
jgi:ATP phosphoribosyltransferase